MSSSSFQVTLAFQRKSVNLNDVTTKTTQGELYARALNAYELSEETQLKLLFNGKRLSKDSDQIVFPSPPTGNKAPKIIVMATSAVVVKEMATKRSDPTIRGFDQELLSDPKARKNEPQHWGPTLGVQSKDFKFCRFEACTWQSFGHRPTEQTPHAFAAMQLLEKMATDPGIVAIMKERELVVGTLGEMDPIDDRLMQKKQQEGGCLLGYNTNGGSRIDIKLRTDDLKGFRPYADLVSTLIHELSHNWVGEHNLLFWTNYAQMRVEYLHTHARLRSTIVQGKTTAELAGLDKAQLENVYNVIMQELVAEMAQHRLHPQMIAGPIHQRCDELAAAATADEQNAYRLGGSSSSPTKSTTADANHDNNHASARERALAAAERRAKEQKEREER